MSPIDEHLLMLHDSHRPSSQVVAVVNSPLRTFLAVSMLATDTESEAAKDDLVDKVSSFFVDAVMVHRSNIASSRRKSRSRPVTVRKDWSGLSSYVLSSPVQDRS